jgi:twitching motility protein PilT
MSSPKKNIMAEFKRLLRENAGDFTEALSFLVLHDIDTLGGLSGEDFVFIKTALEKIRKKKVSPEVLRQAFYKVELVEKKFGQKKSSVHDFMQDNEDWTEVLTLAREKNAGVIFLKAGCAPIFRINGVLQELKELPVYTKPRLLKLISNAFTPQQYSDLMDDKRVDFSLSLPGVSRFRVNAYFENGAPGLTFRQIPLLNPDLSTVGIASETLNSVLGREGGLILVTGSSQSGKSTTCAAIIDYINRHRAFRVVTVENPIEFLFNDIESSITQFELGSDIMSVEGAIQNALRDGADFIFLSILDSARKIEQALSAAESGHTVLAVFPASGCVKALDYMAAFFPAQEQHVFLERLSSVLLLATAQVLCSNIKDDKFLVRELLLPDAGMRNLIRERGFQALQNLFDEMKSPECVSFHRAFAAAIEKAELSYDAVQHQIPETEKFAGKYKHIVRGN